LKTRRTDEVEAKITVKLKVKTLKSKNTDEIKYSQNSSQPPRKPSFVLLVE